MMFESFVRWILFTSSVNITFDNASVRVCKHIIESKE
jgi:hypothetical protein